MQLHIQSIKCAHINLQVNINNYIFQIEAKTKEKTKLFEIGPDGKIRFRGKKLDLSKLTADDLKALGIDPNLSAKEIAKKLKVEINFKTF